MYVFKQDNKLIEKFILSNLAVFKAEAGRLTYGRVTAMRYFLKFLGIEKKVEEAAAKLGDAPIKTSTK